MELRKVQDADVTGKTVLVRVDYNVPLQDGRIVDDRRIQASLPTLRWLLERNAKILLVSHLGRPEGKTVEALRLDPIAERLVDLLEMPVTKLSDCVGPEVGEAVALAGPGDVLLLENVRFHREETTNESAFTHQLAALGELFVNDAFATMHRAHASTVGLADHLPSYAGFLVQEEIKALGPLLSTPEHPYLAVVGGKKAQSKLGPLRDLVSKVDEILLGGGVALTFLHALGMDMGGTVVDHKLADEVQEIRALAEKHGTVLHLPVDVVAAPSLEEGVETVICPADQTPEGWHAFDIGPETIQAFIERLKLAMTVIWTGPMGAYELPAFSRGTQALAEAIAASSAYSLIGGGETGEAMERFGVADRISYISTGGGACLALLRGRVTAALQALLV